MHNTVKLTLPLPPSVNQMYRANRSGRGSPIVKSKKARDYDKTCGWRVCQQGSPKVPNYEPLWLWLRFYLKSMRSSDLDNLQKAGIDVVSRVLRFDDRYIDVIHAYKFEDKKNPRLEMELRVLGAKQ